VFAQHLGIQEAPGMVEMISMQIPVSEMQKIMLMKNRLGAFFV